MAASGTIASSIHHVHNHSSPTLDKYGPSNSVSSDRAVPENLTEEESSSSVTSELSTSAQSSGQDTVPSKPPVSRGRSPVHMFEIGKDFLVPITKLPLKQSNVLLAAATFAITVFGLAWYSYRADRIARWTAAKDFYQQCQEIFVREAA